MVVHEQNIIHGFSSNVVKKELMIDKWKSMEIVGVPQRTRIDQNEKYLQR